jgi:hypothetical protein
MTLPRWQLDILIREQPRIEAQRLSSAMTAASAPHMKASARRDLTRRIGRIAHLPTTEPPEMPKERIDPAAAAAWFAERGIRVETS